MRTARDVRSVLREFTDEEVVAALAGASREQDPYVANVLATEALNRTRRNSAITAQLGEGLCSVTASGRIALVNPAACEMLHARREDLLDRDILADRMFLSELASPGPVEVALSTARRISGEGRFRRLDGSLFEGAYMVSPIVHDGELAGAILLFRDVTRRHEIQRELAESEDRYKAAILGANDGIWDWDPREDRLHVSPRWAALAGAEPAGDLRIDDWLARIHPPDRAQFESVLKAHVAGLVPQLEVEHRIRQPDGTLRWMLARSACVAGKDGKSTRVAGSLTDISARKEAERSLREAEARLRTLLECAPEMLAEMTTDAVFTGLSASAERLLGEPSEALAGASLYEFVASEDLPRVVAAHREALRSPRTQRAVFRLHRRDGTELLAHASFRAARPDPGAAPVGILAIFGPEAAPSEAPP